MSLPETDPNESVNVSAADMAILTDELKALRAQRDELLAALRVARGIVITDRDAAHEGVVNQRTGVIDDPEDAEWVAGYDRALQQIDAAIAKASGQEGGAA